MSKINNSLDYIEHIPPVEKPTIQVARSNLIDQEAEDRMSPILKSSKAEFEDPLLTPESEREDDIKEKKASVIADTILHMML